MTQKSGLPPSGDRHDYMSLGPYWWPDPESPDGRPYVRRDGEVNPERDELDSLPLKRMCSAVDDLALGYYLGGHEPYAEKAVLLLRTWFLEPATRMNPHLRYGQAIPGVCEGRGIGIIDTRVLARLVDSVGLLGGSLAWTDEDQAGLTGWFSRYLDWLLESDIGRDEAAQANNHGTWYDVQVSSFALFTGEESVAHRVLGEDAPRRIAAQIEPDGRQPRELSRTRSLSYSTMNLAGMFDLAALGEAVDLDLWSYRSDDGRSIRAALDWLLEHALGEDPWPHEQITPFDHAELLPLIRRAQTRYPDGAYGAWAERMPATDLADPANLLYPEPREREEHTR